MFLGGFHCRKTSGFTKVFGVHSAAMLGCPKPRQGWVETLVVEGDMPRLKCDSWNDWGLEIFLVLSNRFHYTTDVVGELRNPSKGILRKPRGIPNRGPGSASDFLVVYQRAHLYCSQMVGTAGYQDEAGERRAWGLGNPWFPCVKAVRFWILLTLQGTNIIPFYNGTLEDDFPFPPGGIY